MLACVGLFITLTVFDDRNSKIEGPFDLNPCSITRLYYRKAEYSSTPVCKIYISDRYYPETVTESCDAVKNLIETKMMRNGTDVK